MPEEVWKFGGRSALEIRRAGLMLASMDLSGGLTGHNTSACLPKAWDLSSQLLTVVLWASAFKRKIRNLIRPCWGICEKPGVMASGGVEERLTSSSDLAT